jgi:putative membrane-bound dehydrogenase-like protein
MPFTDLRRGAAIALLAASGFTHVHAEDPVAGNEAVQEIIETFEGRGTLADDTPPTPAEEAVREFQLRPDLEIDLMASEPIVEQPLFGSWDSKGRFWLTQYRQYQFPAGLKIVSYDSHLRAQFDKTPLPPPRGEKGADKITVFEDTDGDGFFDQHRDVITGLNIASSALHGMGRIWVLNPPYLLSYPDADFDAAPDGDPKVELSGFGLEDTHSVATSLTWGMDGWLYGANGSTTTGNVSSAASKNVKWEGQCIWRYHPRTEEFEIYAEGGGNTFSLDIDSKGRVFSGTNNGNTRGMHYEQGSYGKKNWGKHGPLTNPHAFGWFEHMGHEGDTRRFAQAFTIYEGGLLGTAYEGKVIAPNSLANRVHLSQLTAEGTTFRTTDEAEFLTSNDRWFRPVWTGVGPDGGVYIADWYDTRLSHVRPVDDWHKTSGRIYRVRPASGAPKLAPFDLHTASADDLLDHLSHSNEWFRKQAVLEIGWRGVEEARPKLIDMLGGPQALEALWALDLLAQATSGRPPQDVGILQAIAKHEDPALRRWIVKMAGEDGFDWGASVLLDMAKVETHPEVRAQILATAKRLPAGAALPLLWSGDEIDGQTDASGRIPLLAWWALESKVISDSQTVLDFLKREADFVASSLFRDHLAEKLAKRYALEGTERDLQSCAELVELAPDAEVRGRMIEGLAAAFEGTRMPELPEALSKPLDDYLAQQTDSALELGLRRGDADSIKRALKTISDPKAPNAQRIGLAKTLAELGDDSVIEPILAALKSSSTSASLKRALIQAAAQFEDLRVPETLVERYERQVAGDLTLREDALRAMAGRLSWARLLVASVDEWKIPADHVSTEIVRQLSLHGDATVDAGIQRHWKRLLLSMPTGEKEAEAERLRKVVRQSPGDPRAGREHFVARCAICHKLFHEGGDIGPDLTGYERTSVDFWVDNLLNPSLEIREGFGAYIAKTRNGQILTGILDAQDGLGIVLKDMAGTRHRVREDDLESLEASPVSLMPEGLVAGMSDVELQDLFAYLSKQAE